MLDNERIEQIVQNVMAELRQGSRVRTGSQPEPLASAEPPPPATKVQRGDNLFADVDSAAAAATRAFEGLHDLPLELREHMIDHIRRSMRENAQVLAHEAWQETGMGRYEDKTQKNLLNANKAPGTEVLDPRAWTGDNGLVPCTPLGCLMLLKDRLGDLTGARAVIVGRSNIVGKPMAHLLLGQHCTVTIAHSRTRDLPSECRQADILVAAVGRAEMVRGDWIKPGATVLDVGINRVEAAEGKSRLVGDVAFEEARQVAGAITPVPGGIGPMTIACLLSNAMTAACRQHGIEDPIV